MDALKNILAILVSYAAPTSGYPGYGMPSQSQAIQYRKKKPLGVTVIAILMIIGGLSIMVSAAQILYLGSQFLTVDDSFGKILLAIGGMILIIGIAQIILARGLLQLKRWAHTGTYVLTIISLILDFIILLFNRLQDAQSAIGILINFIILYYLARPRIKTAFGKYVPLTSNSGFTDSDFDW
ncbi:MAG: hypothetical protein WC974_04220 [Thermoplasmata archaeon]